MNERTVVGWDGTPEADAALEWAVRRAEQEHDGVLLVDVEDATTPVPGEVVTEEMVEERYRTVDAAARRTAQAHPDLRIGARSVAGDRLEELRRLSKPDNLLVVGTRSRRGPRTRYRWSLGARLAASASGAVAVVPTTPEETRTGVVVGVDGSEVSAKAARFAAREARRLGQELIVVHAWLDPVVSVFDMRVEGPYLGELEEEHQALLDSMVHSLESGNPDLTVSPVMVHSEAHPALKDAVATASLLVVGSEQARGVERLLLGSISHAMILDIQVPTIVVAPECMV